MRRFNSTRLTLMLLTFLLLWSSSMDTCNARRGSHRRHSGPLSASLLKKKGKSHGNKGNNHHHSSKPKPYHKSPSAPKSSPTPGEDTPSAPPPKKAPYPKGSPPKATKPPRIVDIPSPQPVQPETGSNIFNVLDYGAKGDGNSDDTKVSF